MPDESQTIDTTNKFMVATRGDSIVVMRPASQMSKRDALVFAAWIVALAEEHPGEFNVSLQAVLNT